jgi:hypothetical protein
MDKITIKKGRHTSNFLDQPFKVFFNAKKKTYTWKVKFIEASAYDLKDNDQLDWNKLCGVSYSLRPLFNSFMIGWRYNLKKELFELSPYIHDADTGENFYAEKLNVTPFSIKNREEVEIIYNAKKGTLEFKANVNSQIFQTNKVKPKWFGKEVSTYFGGNETAPTTIELYKSKVNV